MQFHVYVLYSKSHDKYYIGQTENLQSRVKAHNSGKAKYTKPYLPWTLVWSVEKSSRKDALSTEKKLKNLKSRTRLIAAMNKDGIIHNPNDL